MSIVKGHYGAVHFNQTGAAVKLRTIPPNRQAKYVYLGAKQALELAEKLKRAAERAAALKVK